MSAPVVTGAKPVTPEISALGVHTIESVVSVPVAVASTTVSQLPLVMRLVLSVAVPLAILTGVLTFDTTDHELAPLLGELVTHLTKAAVFAGRTITVFAPDDSTVTAPVLKFTKFKDQPL